MGGRALLGLMSGNVRAVKDPESLGCVWSAGAGAVS